MTASLPQSPENTLLPHQKMMFSLHTKFLFIHFFKIANQLGNYNTDVFMVKLFDVLRNL